MAYRGKDREPAMQEWQSDVVVLMEPQYKPSTEWQAVRRAYRMGQTKPVMVYRLIAKDTIEDRIVELTGFKADLFDRVARQSDLADPSPRRTATARAGADDASLEQHLSGPEAPARMALAMALSCHTSRLFSVVGSAWPVRYRGARHRPCVPVFRGPGRQSAEGQPWPH